MQKDDFKDVEWLEISLLYKCNVKCEFCFEWDLRYKYKDKILPEKVYDLLKEWYLNDKRFVIFTWGEPTLDNNLLKYIEYAKMIWFTLIRVHTNWFKFKDYNYLLSLYKAWLWGITISIHWYDRVHDLISGVSWSFQIILIALINFEKIKKLDSTFIIDTNTVICKKNYKFLIQLFLFLKKFSIKRIMFTYPYDSNLNVNKLSNIIVSYDELKKYLNLFLVEVKKSKINDFVLESIPFCMIDKKYYSYIEKNFKTSKDQYFLWYFTNYEDKKSSDWREKHSECSKCIKNSECKWFSIDNNKVYWIPKFNFIS